MTRVHCAIEIGAPPARVWEVVMDPRRLADWVTIHRHLGPVPERLRRGATFEQTLNLRGAPLHVAWTVVDVDPPHRALWEGQGPAHSRASIVYELRPDGENRTIFDYTNEFKPPGGALGAVAGRVLVGGLSQREAQRSLQRLKMLIENE
ncbi:MAG: SRPBCC family protein [Actinobacteria bacterium]|nr:SRPBCC family protein [Actinomycetota bacterium]